MLLVYLDRYQGILYFLRMYIINRENRTIRTASIIQLETQFKRDDSSTVQSALYVQEREEGIRDRSRVSFNTLLEQTELETAGVYAFVVACTCFFCEFMVVIMLVLTYKAFSLSRSPVWWYISIFLLASRHFRLQAGCPRD